MQTTISRILVVWDSTSFELSLLPTAAELAAVMQAELHGLFIEDDNLVRLAGLPFAQEIGSTSALVRPLSIAAIERRFRSLAEQVREALAQTAERARIAWSFQVARGTVMTASLDVSRETDLLVLARRTPFAQTRRERSSDVIQSRPVAVLYDGSAAAKRALIAASVFSQSKCQSPGVILTNQKKSFESLRQEAAEILRKHGTPQFSTHIVASPSELLTLLQQQPSSLLLLPRDCAFLRTEPLSQLLDRRFPTLIGVVN